jgi:hypothetical protein
MRTIGKRTATSGLAFESLKAMRKVVGSSFGGATAVYAWTIAVAVAASAFAPTSLTSGSNRGVLGVSTLTGPLLYRKNATSVESPPKHRFERTAPRIQHVDQPCIIAIGGVRYNVTSWGTCLPPQIGPQSLLFTHLDSLLTRMQCPSSESSSRWRSNIAKVSQQGRYSSLSEGSSLGRCGSYAPRLCHCREYGYRNCAGHESRRSSFDVFASTGFQMASNRTTVYFVYKDGKPPLESQTLYQGRSHWCAQVLGCVCPAALCLSFLPNVVYRPIGWFGHTSGTRSELDCAGLFAPARSLEFEQSHLSYRPQTSSRW